MKRVFFVVFTAIATICPMDKTHSIFNIYLLNKSRKLYINCMLHKKKTPILLQMRTRNTPSVRLSIS